MLSIAKLQNLKAIYNSRGGSPSRGTDVINRKTTKFESNSQPLARPPVGRLGCYQSQNYKIWKQFTTLSFDSTRNLQLLSIAKLQNLKAIHNKALNKQQEIQVVINHKTTKFESNSQRFLTLWNPHKSCYQSQNHKIWKQFTTCHLFGIDLKKMLSITKLQNLKAIHNRTFPSTKEGLDVINHKTTKFESNSQQEAH